MDLLKIGKNAFVFKSLLTAESMTKQPWPHVNPCCAPPYSDPSVQTRLTYVSVVNAGSLIIWDGLS